MLPEGVSTLFRHCNQVSRRYNRKSSHFSTTGISMAIYDYHCEANQRTVEVRHAMSERLQTWGELCECAGIDPGDTPPETPVKRLITGGHTNTTTEPMQLGSILPKHQ